MYASSKAKECEHCAIPANWGRPVFNCVLLEGRVQNRSNLNNNGRRVHESCGVGNQAGLTHEGKKDSTQVVVVFTAGPCAGCQQLP